jgi:hypothetical protein
LRWGRHAVFVLLFCKTPCEMISILTYAHVELWIKILIKNADGKKKDY